MTKRCSGCGVLLQCENENSLGYIPFNKINTASYCMRCFKMTHYGQNLNSSNPFQNDELLNKINKTNIHTIFLIDFLNITDNVLKIFSKITTKKTLVINKCEILPKFLKPNILIKFLKKEYKINADIILKGSSGSRSFEIIYDYLKNNNITECLFAGITNAGKSTLINDLIKLTKSENSKVTVNKNANTTLDFIELNMNEFKIIDTPGFVFDWYLDIPKSKKIKSYIFQMKKEEILNLTDTLYLQCLNDVNINYFTNFLYEKQIKKNYKINTNLDTEVKINANQDLIIYGVGLINFKKDTIIKTNIDKKYLNIRESFFRR